MVRWAVIGIIPFETIIFSNTASRTGQWLGQATHLQYLTSERVKADDHQAYFHCLSTSRSSKNPGPKPEPPRPFVCVIFGHFSLLCRSFPAHRVWQTAHRAFSRGQCNAVPAPHPAPSSRHRQVRCYSLHTCSIGVVGPRP